MCWVYHRAYLPESKGRDPCDIAEMLKYGLRSRIRAPASVSRKNHRNSSLCAPDTVSISSRHRRISDIKSPDSLVLEIAPPLSPSEVFPNSSALSSPSTVIHHNSSYTNLPAIPEFPAQNPTTETSGGDSVHHVHWMSWMMPSILENMAELAAEWRKFWWLWADGNCALDIRGSKHMLEGQSVISFKFVGVHPVTYNFGCYW